MTGELKQSDVDNKVDPSVARQLDNNVPLEKKLEDFYGICDGQKICMLGTARPNIGPVHRSMAVAKRSGCDFLFLANTHSQKFSDLEHASVVNICFHNSTNQDWVSITGKATKTDNSDPRIKEVWSRGASAWFGDLGDGKHDGSPNDPRMALIEVKPNFITYWKSTSTGLGFVKELVQSNLTGEVPVTGNQRDITEQEIAQARQKDGSMTQ
ncbi:hypothetical protein MBLNU457_g2810t1 [Dothideomycetes sp. NU457]